MSEGQWRAFCSCGWESFECERKFFAEKEADEHVIAMTRANDSAQHRTEIR